MVREQIKVNIPDDWMENLKHGRCWCGKDHTKFDKGQKYYCSQDHADQYKKRIKYWSTFKNDFLAKNGEVCGKCGMSKTKMDDLNEQNKRIHFLKVAEQYPDAIKQGRAVLLLDLQKKYEAIMDDAHVAENMPYQVRENFDMSYHTSQFNEKWFQIEVDHKIAVVLGGDMWDEDNLQVLCSDCHKDKTREDMHKLKIVCKAKGNEPLDDITVSK